ncbi:hypothetical protein H4R34_005800, partial [Dimargaris verticillata]
MRRFTLIDTLLRQGADPNSTNSYRETPLYAAVVYAFTQHVYALSTVETLLTHLGATLGLPNARGWTVLHFLANAAQTLSHEQAALVYLQGCLNQLATVSPKAFISPSIVWIRDDRQRTALDLTHPAADNPVRQLLQRFMHCYPAPPLRSFSHHSLPGGTPWGVPVDAQGHRTTDSSSPLPSPAASRRTSLCSNHSAVQSQRHPSPHRSASFSDAANESRAMLPSPIHLSLPDPHHLPSNRHSGPVTPAPPTPLNPLDHHRRRSLHLTQPTTPVPSRAGKPHSVTLSSTAAFHINGDPQLSLPPLRTPQSDSLGIRTTQTTNGSNHQPPEASQTTRPTTLMRVISSPPCMASSPRTLWNGNGAASSHQALSSARSSAQAGPPLGTFSPPRYTLGKSFQTSGGAKPLAKARKVGGARYHTLQSDQKLATADKPLSARPLVTPTSTNPSPDRYDQTVSTIMNHVTDVIHAKRKDHQAVQSRLQDEINTLAKTLQAVTEERQSIDQQAAHLRDQNQNSLQIDPSVQLQLPDSWAAAFATTSRTEPSTLPLAKGEPYIANLRQALQRFLAK